jgi:Fic family protein
LYGFTQRLVLSSLASDGPPLSFTAMRALNQVAIRHTHSTRAGKLRQCQMTIGTSAVSLSARRKLLPSHFGLPVMMRQFVDEVNDRWAEADSVALAAFVLWSVCHIHPFVDGNGRTARATSYYVLCLKAGGWIEGDPILPEAIRRNRHGYVEGLLAGNRRASSGPPDLRPLHSYLCQMLDAQLSEAT